MGKKATVGEKVGAELRFRCECLGALMQSKAEEACKAAVRADRKARTKPKRKARK